MCMGTSSVCTTISTANLKLVANSSAAERSISYPHKEGPAGPSICTQQILLGQPALDRIGAMFGFPFLQHFVIATLGLNHFT